MSNMLFGTLVAVGRLLLRSGGNYFLAPDGWTQQDGQAIILPDSGTALVASPHPSVSSEPAASAESGSTTTSQQNSNPSNLGSILTPPNDTSPEGGSFVKTDDTSQQQPDQPQVIPLLIFGPGLSLDVLGADSGFQGGR